MHSQGQRLRRAHGVQRPRIPQASTQQYVGTSSTTPIRISSAGAFGARRARWGGWTEIEREGGQPRAAIVPVLLMIANVCVVLQPSHAIKGTRVCSRYVFGSREAALELCAETVDGMGKAV